MVGADAAAVLADTMTDIGGRAQTGMGGPGTGPSMTPVTENAAAAKTGGETTPEVDRGLVKGETYQDPPSRSGA